MVLNWKENLHQYNLFDQLKNISTRTISLKCKSFFSGFLMSESSSFHFIDEQSDKNNVLRNKKLSMVNGIQI